MTTIGYGDITAKTTEERLVMIFFTLVSCGIFGYIINSIGNILGDIKQKSDQYLTELAKLNQYFKKYQVSLQLQANVRRYLQFKYKEGIQDKLSELESLNNLSQHLQNQIKMDVVSRQLKQIGFLKQICKEETFCQLSLQVQEKIYQPEQVILDQNEIKEPAIQIINYGRVLKNSQYDLSSQVNDIYELKEKQSFGVTEFFMNLESSKFNYKSKELTSIYSLNLSAFLKNVLQFFINQENQQQQKDTNSAQKIHQNQQLLSLYDNTLSSIDDQNLFSSQKLNFRGSINSQQNRDHIEKKSIQFIDQLKIDIKPPLIIQRKKHEHEKQIGDQQIKAKSLQKLEAIEEQNENQKLNQQQNTLRNNQISITSIQDIQYKNDQISVLQEIQNSIKDIFQFLISQKEIIKQYQKYQGYQNVNSSTFKKIEDQLVSNLNIKSGFQTQDTNYNNRSSYIDLLMPQQHKQDIQNFCYDLDRIQKYKTYYPKFNYDLVIEECNSRSYKQNIPLILRLIKIRRKTVNLKKKSKIIKQL
ncbi:cation channel family protein (macronuclear) [Tetrahymena thermophila SB210]|uniref:Cation channel family protein n=1 Tax=Tetrahymena thermophila (strain SB210) TaxID=312017 RepID=W7X8E0_TETTS|nr:cation channel family protein [Tetrahymena thermophila SB210]EWS73612.1 cation channel family protein [Tetrahymena thermophila SB210]|eukprot:XP_012653842.1 cation channel family protein [Tetrahymena thermophila SB210]